MRSQKDKKINICIPVDTGGHLTQALYLIDAFEGHDIFFATIDTPRTRDLPHRKYLFPSYSGKLWPLRFSRLLPPIISIMRKERPTIIFSTGAEIAVPFFYIGKLLGAKTVFVESYIRTSYATGTGKLVYPISDLFLVQHKTLLLEYGRKARYEGSIL